MMNIWKQDTEKMIETLRYKAENIKAHIEPEFFEKVAKRLEEYKLQESLPYKVGDIVWVIDEYENDYDGYVFMATCDEYVIVAVEYAHCVGDFKIQLLDMVDESYDNFGVNVEIYHKDKVFPTQEAAEKALKEKASAE